MNICEVNSYIISPRAIVIPPCPPIKSSSEETPASSSSESNSSSSEHSSISSISSISSPSSEHSSLLHSVSHDKESKSFGSNSSNDANSSGSSGYVPPGGGSPTGPAGVYTYRVSYDCVAGAWGTVTEVHGLRCCYHDFAVPNPALPTDTCHWDEAAYGNRLGRGWHDDDGSGGCILTYHKISGNCSKRPANPNPPLRFLNPIPPNRVWFPNATGIDGAPGPDPMIAGLRNSLPRDRGRTCCNCGPTWQRYTANFDCPTKRWKVVRDTQVPPPLQCCESPPQRFSGRVIASTGGVRPLTQGALDTNTRHNPRSERWDGGLCSRQKWSSGRACEWRGFQPPLLGVCRPTTTTSLPYGPTDTLWGANFERCCPCHDNTDSLVANSCPDGKFQYATSTFDNAPFDAFANEPWKIDLATARKNSKCEQKCRELLDQQNANVDPAARQSFAGYTRTEVLHTKKVSTPGGGTSNPGPWRPLSPGAPGADLARIRGSHCIHTNISVCGCCTEPCSTKAYTIASGRGAWVWTLIGKKAPNGGYTRWGVGSNGMCTTSTGSIVNGEFVPDPGKPLSGMCYKSGGYLGAAYVVLYC